MANVNLLSGDGAYYQLGSGIYIPTWTFQESKSKAVQVTDDGWGMGSINLEQHIRWQLMRSRRKYFVFHEMYAKDTWIRATLDYIVRRVTRDENRLVDFRNPMNPNIDKLQRFLDDSFVDGAFQDIMRGVALDVLQYHQAYVYIEKNRRGEPLHFWPMDSRIVFPLTDLHGSIIAHAQVYNGAVSLFHPDEVLYWPIWNNGTNPLGISGMETLYDSVMMELHANRYNEALFENNLNIGAVFSMQNVEAEEVEKNRRYLLDNYAGAQNAYSPLIISGDAKMLRDGATAIKDINFELLIRIARHRVGAVFGVPESLLGIPDNTNRATANSHERSTYVNTILPLRRMINSRFTQQFIRRVWGSNTIRLDEPLNSLLPTTEELEAVDKVASMGILFNDYLEMTGRARVPNGDYWVIKIPGTGGLQRIDVASMPGLGDEHFDFAAYQAQHQEQERFKQDQTAAGMPPAASTPWVPPRPQDTIQNEPIGARVLDLSRSFGIISRRNPVNPGSRGAATLYTTSNGKSRYGTPPKGKPSPAGPSGETPNNSLANPPDVKPPASVTDEDRVRISAAEAQVSGLFNEALAGNWTDDQFFNKLTENGWEPSGSPMDDIHTARAYARLKATTNTDKVYSILGSEGRYVVFENDLSAYDKTDTIFEPKGTKPGGADTGNPTRLKQPRLDTGNPKSREHQDAGGGSLKRSALDAWIQRAQS